MFADEALSVTMLALVAARLVTVPVVMPAVAMVAMVGALLLVDMTLGNPLGMATPVETSRAEG